MQLVLWIYYDHGRRFLVAIPVDKSRTTNASFIVASDQNMNNEMET